MLDDEVDEQEVVAVNDVVDVDDDEIDEIVVQADAMLHIIDDEVVDDDKNEHVDEVDTNE